jgi:hypothetical protein
MVDNPDSAVPLVSILTNLPENGSAANRPRAEAGVMLTWRMTDHERFSRCREKLFFPVLLPQ